MIRPVNFTFNEQTAVNNAFQIAGNEQQAQLNALREFDAFVEMLRSKDIDILVVEDTPLPHTPDSIFPNNWISFHEEGSLVLFPMYAQNRRLERKFTVLNEINNRFHVQKVIDLTPKEKEEKFLEGTGSMVLDRDNRIAYACLSPRTDKSLLIEFCERMDYKPVAFHAQDSKGTPIYHTNVMMCLADRYAVICLESIPDITEKQAVSDAVHQTGKEILDITMRQMNQFAGNMLQVNNTSGKKYVVMSTRALKSLIPGQVNTLEKYNEILHAPLDSIESNGGGSARCMMAEIHLQPKGQS